MVLVYPAVWWGFSIPLTYVSIFQNFFLNMKMFLVPAIVGALTGAGNNIRAVRPMTLEVMRQDYVRTAYSRGNSPRAALYRHVLRNAVVPTVAFLAMTVADIVAGSVIIEQVFAIPGIGRLLLTSIANRDFPVVQAIVVILALWVVLVNCLADLLNQRLDPRLRLQ